MIVTNREDCKQVSQITPFSFDMAYNGMKEAARITLAAPLEECAGIPR